MNHVHKPLGLVTSVNEATEEFRRLLAHIVVEARERLAEIAAGSGFSQADLEDARAKATKAEKDLDTFNIAIPAAPGSAPVDTSPSRSTRSVARPRPGRTEEDPPVRGGVQESGADGHDSLEALLERLQRLL